ncbi:phosphonate ABC transporter ATP-binding protein [Cellulomonas sp. GbtcB1]|uniref:phosphonate ABC transporter ATP-binding protein n=1 Tax=Cellulomonas sp. GbtcB1 TaxID=2824746 RepID=UPI001C30ADEF|nr:ATP-binding cassette domain-containing protein [Cellulomonas sp. GbtcB1]
MTGVPAPAHDGLQVRGLVVQYPGRPDRSGTVRRHAVDEVDLDIAPGEVAAAPGPTGCGKSTTLRAVAGLAPVTAGTVHVAGRLVREGGAGAHGVSHDERATRRQIAMIFQQVNLVRRLTVLDNVCAGSLGRLPLRRSVVPALLPREVRAEALWCLEQVGLADRALDVAGQLSGGQQQRVAVARALCQRAPVMLADEPTSALDLAAADQVMALLAELTHAQGLATVVVAHDPELAHRHVDRVVGMAAGRVVLQGATREVSLADIAGLYATTVPSATVPAAARSAA